PAGAFTREETVAIQEITNQAHGAKGRAFRITPEGLDTPQPMTLRYRYGEAELYGTAAELASLAYQDGQGFWNVYTDPARDAAAQTISIQTRHFSDWSFVTGVQLRASANTVIVGGAAEIVVVECTEVPSASQPGIAVLANCNPDQAELLTSG